MVIALLDVSYARSARGNSSLEPAAVEQVGIVWVKSKASGLSVESSEVIAGPQPVTTTIQQLAVAELIVGHGLHKDYRAFAMVSAIPPWLLSRTVDTLAVLHDVRGGRMPAGLNLGALTALNLRDLRNKTQRGTHEEPRDDAWLAGRLWWTMRTTGVVRWAPTLGHAADHEHGPEWSSTQGATVALDPGALERLAGQPPANFDEWDRQVTTLGRTLARAPHDPKMAALAVAGRASVAAESTALQLVVDRLLANGLLAAPPAKEMMLAALQWFGPVSNTRIRQRLARGTRPLSPNEAGSYAWSLFRMSHKAAEDENWLAWRSSGSRSSVRSRWLRLERACRDLAGGKPLELIHGELAQDLEALPADVPMAPMPWTPLTDPRIEPDNPLHRNHEVVRLPAKPPGGIWHRVADADVATYVRPLTESQFAVGRELDLWSFYPPPRPGVYQWAAHYSPARPGGVIWDWISAAALRRWPIVSEDEAQAALQLLAPQDMDAWHALRP